MQHKVWSLGFGRNCLLGWVLASAAFVGCGLENEETASLLPCGSGVGALQLSEAMINPDGADAGHEWLEIYNAGTAPQSLKGLEIHVADTNRHQAHVLVDPPVLPAGEVLLLLGGNVLPKQVDGLEGPAPYIYADALSFPNRKGSIGLVCNGTLLDALSYGTALDEPAPPESGMAIFRRSLLGADEDEDENKEGRLGAWCALDASANDTASMRGGTPGQANPSCESELVAEDASTSELQGAIDIEAETETGIEVDIEAGIETENDPSEDMPEPGNDLSDMPAVSCQSRIAPPPKAYADWEKDFEGQLSDFAPSSSNVRLAEILANPTGADAGKEWIEIKIVGNKPVSLLGLGWVQELDSSSNRHWRMQQGECFWAYPDERWVVRFGASSLQDEALPWDENILTFSLLGSSLHNGASRWHLWLDVEDKNLARDGDALPTDDAVVWLASELGADVAKAAVIDTRTTPVAVAGMSWSQAEREEEAEACLALPSPGAPNPGCGVQCMDKNGVARQVRSPKPGDLYLHEVHANPEGPDGQRDWFEVFVAASAPVDLLGLRARNISGVPSDAALQSSSGGRTLDIAAWDASNADDADALRACLSVEPGAYLVLAGEEASNDDILADAVLQGPSGGLLYNSQAGLALLNEEDLILDKVVYPASKSGLSAFRLGQEGDFDPGDTASLWCTASKQSDIHATPGRSDHACP